MSSDRPTVAVIGAGLAGMSAALSLARRDFQVRLLEGKSIPGGRASSYEAQETGEPVDNCQHVLMGCCTNLQQFYAEVGVEDRIRWLDEIQFLDRNGRVHRLAGSGLPAPLHLMPSFLGLGFLSVRDRLGIARAFGAILLRDQAGDPPFSEWLARHGQTPGAIRRFWQPIVVSALNEEPEACSTRYALQVFRDGFLSHPRAYRMGIPRVPLLELYQPCVAALEAAGAEVRFRARVQSISTAAGRVEGVVVGDTPLPADYVICATAFDAAQALVPEPVRSDPEFAKVAALEPSPICGVHLWWDRQVTELGHCALLDRTVQWMFNKSEDYATEAAAPPGGRPTHMGLVVSAARDWLRLSRREILEIAEREVREAFPGTRGAVLTRASVIKEAKATYSPVPGVEQLRPEAATRLPNLFLAGDWVRNGWPATMEAAVRSGYLAAEQVLAAAGRPETLRAPDLPWSCFLRRRGP